MCSSIEKYIEHLDNLFRYLGHRTPLTPLEDLMSISQIENGHIEDIIGRYVYIKLDYHTYRTFYEESGSGNPTRHAPRGKQRCTYVASSARRHRPDSVIPRHRIWHAMAQAVYPASGTAAEYDTGRYRTLLAIVARDFEPSRWEIEAILRHPGVSFNRMIPASVRGFMAPQDRQGHVDEVVWVYENGN
jgi:hypothetical protein